MEYVLLALAVAALAVVLLIRRPEKGAGPDLSRDIALLVQRLEGIDARMTAAQSDTQSLTADLFGRLGEVTQATQAVAEQARQFTSLQELLRAPKARGGLGEAMLEELLGQILPPSSFARQFRFATGAIVDAVVFAGGRKICIDSKFPLSNFERVAAATSDTERVHAERAFADDVQGHINDIARRYIVPDEGTLDFAVMYVPVEAVYGEVLRLKYRGRSLFEIAMEARVIPMSPLTMYSYLQTILFGLRCLRIEEDAQTILQRCGRLTQDVERFAAEYDTLGKHVTNAYTRYGEASRKLDRLRISVDQIVDLSTEGREEPDEAGPSAATA